jgi:3'-phosphoadenosine 5'-phosphosulfate sulfotransferase (PAPS reductase)/FAD synthetase
MDRVAVGSACYDLSVAAPEAESSPGPDLASYDVIVVAFSGGKDSLACVLHLLEEGERRGLDLKSRIELWHHDVDGGAEGSDLMDWPVTRSYCEAVAKHLGLPIYFSWKTGGFEREMLREESRTAPVRWQNPDGTIGQSGGKGGKLATRLRFPQVSADLSVRWCSAYLKIDVCAAAIAGQDRFKGKRMLVLSGERAAESSARAKYATFEPDRTHCPGPRARRHVDRWRPVHAWSDAAVWEIIAKRRIAPHPAYVIGWGRVSCMTCIFGSPNQWASVRKLDSEKFERIAAYERRFGSTIQRKLSIVELADKGTPYDWAKDAAREALSRTFDGPIFLGEKWTMPAGALRGESCGPT